LVDSFFNGSGDAGEGGVGFGLFASCCVGLAPAFAACSASFSWGLSSPNKLENQFLADSYPFRITSAPGILSINQSIITSLNVRNMF
jgi:hypothetical protein